MNDYNEITTEVRYTNKVVKYGLCKRNKRASRLQEFCEKHKINIEAII